MEKCGPTSVLGCFMLLHIHQMRLELLIYTGFANTPNCSDDSTEVTEGVTSTPDIFGNKHSFVLTFFATNIIYVNCKHCKP